MADAYIRLLHTRERGEINIGKELPSKSYDSKEAVLPVREMEFYGSKVLFRESDTATGKELTVFGFKQSMPHKSGRFLFSEYEGIDVNIIQDEKTQNEIVEKIRTRIPITDMIKYKSLIVEFSGDEQLGKVEHYNIGVRFKTKRYSLIKHRDFDRLVKK